MRTRTGVDTAVSTCPRCIANDGRVQGPDGVLPARGGGQLQDRGVQGVGARQGVQDGVREDVLQRQHERGAVQTLHRPHAPDQGPPPVSR